MNLKIKNMAEGADLYVYGEITDDCWSDNDVGALQVKNTILDMQPGETLNVYVNSPGGNVFTASAIVSQLKRAKEKGIKVNAYIDGVAASAASFLIMVADTITAYKNSEMMIHKPMTFSWGNADDLMKDVETLNQLEENVMIPLYMEKSTIAEDEIRQRIDKESWLNANDMAEIFGITISDDSKEIAACDYGVLKNYRNTPKELIALAEEDSLKPDEPKDPPEPSPEPTPIIDYSYFEDKVMRGRK